MADFGSPVVNPQGYDPTKALSAVLGIKQQQTELAKQQSELQQTQQTTRQRAGVANWMSSFDPTKHVGPDGTLDLDNVLTDPKLRQAAGDQFPDLVSKMIGVKQSQLTAKQQLTSLNSDLLKQFQSGLSGIRTDPDVVADTPAGREKAQQWVGQFAALGPDAARVAQIYGPVLEHVPQGKLAQTLSNVQLQAMDASTQAGKQAPEFTSTGATLKQTNPQAAGGNLGPSKDMKVQIPPGYDVFSDPRSGNFYLRNQQNPNDVKPLGGQQNSNAPPVMEPGQTTNIEHGAVNDEQHYTSIKSAADQAPATKNILSNIIKLADETKTGKGSKEIADAEAALGQYIPGFKGARDAATKRQLLGKYVQQLALKSFVANGATTDAAEAQVAGALPNPENMTPDAIKQAARLIQAQTQISQARGAVAEKYKQEHGGHTQGLRAIDSQFMQHTDPRVFEYIGLSKSERQKFLNENFRDPKARAAFADQLSVIDHYGGFNYEH